MDKPGEACGLPIIAEFSILYPNTVVDAWVKGTQGERAGTVEYVPLTELLQARAAHENLRGHYTALEARHRKIGEEWEASKAALASSEARVRILSEALEYVERRTDPEQKNPTKDNYIRSTRLRAVVVKALLEVQR